MDDDLQARLTTRRVQLLLDQALQCVSDAITLATIARETSSDKAALLALNNFRQAVNTTIEEQARGATVRAGAESVATSPLTHGMK